MYLHELHLQQFRNLTEVTYRFDHPWVLITGPNGRGKSTLLEAILLLSAARSYRCYRERELIQHGQTQALIEATISPQRTSISRPLLTETDSTASIPITTLGLELALIPTDDRTQPRLQTRFSRNGNLLKQRSDLLGWLPGVSFFLSDLQLLRGGGDDRRRWLDAAISQQNAQHLRDLIAYERVRRQRNQLLKQSELSPSMLNDQLAAWDAQLLTHGAPICLRRHDYLNHLMPVAVEQYAMVSLEQERLSFSYICPWIGETPAGSRIVDSLSAAEVRLPDELNSWTQTMHDSLRRYHSLERQRGQSLVGPHRDDIWLGLNERNACQFASQGQQRSLVLALKRAELSLLQQVHPARDGLILLLDDVMAELDPQRQEALMSWFHPDLQVFITTTHTTQFLLPEEVQHIQLA